MGSHHGKRYRGDRYRSRASAAPDAGRDSLAGADVGVRAGADVGAAAALDAAYERYREARDRHAEAKYEYKSAKYALKAARIRADRGAGGSRVRRGDDPWQATDRHGGGSLQTTDRYDGEGRQDADRYRERGGRKQVVLQVVETERIGEHVQRLTLGGDGFADFRDNHYTDKYVKILFVDPALGLEPPYDVPSLRRSLPKHQRPVRRTYTVHSVDPVARTLAIDVVLHGDTGVAGPWAARAQVGDKVAFSGPGGKYTPDPGADWHLLVGDESALPAVSAALAALPSDAVGAAFLEVAGPGDERTLEHPAGVTVTWLHRDPAAPDAGQSAPGVAQGGTGEGQGGPPEGQAGPGEGQARLAMVQSRPASEWDPRSGARGLLAEAVESMAWRPGRVHAFVHGEKSTVRRLRRHLLEDRRMDKRMLSLSSYWTRGQAED